MTRVRDHGGGVRSLRVPIPDNPLGHTLVHVVDTDRGPVLVDTGWDDPGSWDALSDGLAACGTSVAELHGVVVTHHHPDHHGLSGRVREASGAWIAMHAADTAVVRRTRETRPGRWYTYMEAKLAAAGAPDDHLAPLRSAGPRTRLPGLSPALPDREIVPGDLLPLAGRRLRAIWTPGHTPGHVCLHLEEEHPAGLAGNGRLFSGDHLLPGITPHIGLYEDPDDATVTDPLGDYLDSLERIGRLAPAEVLPAHQHAFTDAPARVRELLDHHEERLSGLHALLSAPLTPWQLAVRMEWNRPWEQIPHASRNIAVSEAEAHLRRLVKQGRAEPVPGSDPVTYRAV
ncbi:MULTISPECIES: MBL fold metallo-hydrolase [Streptomyces]|uniref:MBL fold metallo-hydrolase n=1 Tax=Streptomyces doudnae TaxID=3075536 RepID=A0ABD5ENU7_9ACTN|nr:MULTISPECIES: MBL fold metallo-hydrolase [unclassified Streptomyces]MDT0435067.1 MBL fold metallo-hydrolase [Streptomyces sp. DSM 41981]MYQ66840.1 MBL fold metallo-hydrolase [Streptomyces sp. SID4950]SCE26118.1 Glyoxylase, beta-lactamase superfamily II [Streptomyces sp. SolWspMP-5a-2]